MVICMNLVICCLITIFFKLGFYPRNSNDSIWIIWFPNFYCFMNYILFSLIFPELTISSKKFQNAVKPIFFLNETFYTKNQKLTKKNLKLRFLKTKKLSQGDRRPCDNASGDQPYPMGLHWGCVVGGNDGTVQRWKWLGHARKAVDRGFFYWYRVISAASACRTVRRRPMVPLLTLKVTSGRNFSGGRLAIAVAIFLRRCFSGFSYIFRVRSCFDNFSSLGVFRWYFWTTFDIETLLVTSRSLLSILS